MRGEARSLHELSASPAVAGDGIDMTALEIVAVTAGIFLIGHLAVSELRTDFSQRLQMKRLIAEGLPGCVRRVTGGDTIGVFI